MAHMITDAQMYLSVSQAIPVLGPIFISPVKAFVSLCQIIYNIFRAVLFGLVTASLNKDSQSREWTYHQFEKGAEEAGYGLGHLFYSVINFCTVGIAGIAFEGLKLGVNGSPRNDFF